MGEKKGAGQLDSVQTPEPLLQHSSSASAAQLRTDAAFVFLGILRHMRTLLNLAIIFASGLLAMFSSGIITYALLAATSHGTVSDPMRRSVGLIFITIMFWPLHVFIAIVATAAAIVWRQSRKTRKANEAIAKAFRETE
jgi:hypothetical protein